MATATIPSVPAGVAPVRRIEELTHDDIPCAGKGATSGELTRPQFFVPAFAARTNHASRRSTGLRSGTAAARGAADILLTDDDFASIEAAVEEGRHVFDNVQKAIAFVLPTNLGEAVAIGLQIVMVARAGRAAASRLDQPTRTPSAGSPALGRHGRLIRCGRVRIVVCGPVRM